MENTNENEEVYPIAYVYEIRSQHIDKIYIGSTTQDIEARLLCHKAQYLAFLQGNPRYVSSFELLKYPDADIHIIRTINNTTSAELKKVERHFVEWFREVCVNIRIPWRSEDEKKDQPKKYREQHKEKLKEYFKMYRAENKLKMCEWRKEYFQANKQKIYEYKNKKVPCPTCGCMRSRQNMGNHVKNKH